MSKEAKGSVAAPPVLESPGPAGEAKSSDAPPVISATLSMTQASCCNATMEALLQSRKLEPWHKCPVCEAFGVSCMVASHRSERAGKADMDMTLHLLYSALSHTPLNSLCIYFILYDHMTDTLTQGHLLFHSP